MRVSRRRGGRARRSPLGWPAAAFVVIGLVSLAPTPYLPPSWRPSALLGLLQALPGTSSWQALYTWRAAADLLLGWGLFLAVRRAFAGRSLRPLGLALAAGLGLTLALGLLAYGGLVDLDGYRPPYTVRPETRRLSSIFLLSGWLSQYLVIATPVALAALAGAGRRARRLLPALLTLAVVGLALTMQRGAWVAAALQLVFWALVAARAGSLPRRQLRRLALAGLVVAALAVALTAGLGSLGTVARRASSIESGLTARSPVWRAAVEMTAERPLLGWGLGSYSPAYDLLHPRGSPEAHRFRGTAHSLYLNVSAERGLLGLVALALVGWALAACLRRPRPGQERWALALGASLTGAAVYGLVQYLFYLRNVSWLLWLLFGCAALVSRRESHPWLERAARALALGGLLVVLPLRLALSQPPAFAGNRSFGWHEAEPQAAGEFRWIEGSAAARLPWRGEVLVLELANGHPRAGARPVTVTVSVDGEVATRVEVAGGWQEERIELAPPRRPWLLLELAAEPTFRPFSDFRRYPELGRSSDIRRLGVAVRGPRWLEAAAQGPEETAAGAVYTDNPPIGPVGGRDPSPTSAAQED